jgi:hypothetical protein
MEFPENHKATEGHGTGEKKEFEGRKKNLLFAGKQGDPEIKTKSPKKSGEIDVR